METYRIIKITHHYDDEDYYNEFVGISDLFNAVPYIDIETIPKSEEQSEKVKVQFP